MNFTLAVQSLVDAGVEFVVIGGWAAILHGSSYLTNDLDICYSRHAENLARLTKALAPFQPRLRDVPKELPFVWDEHTLRNGTIFTLSCDLGSIDLLAEVSGVGEYADVLAQSVVVKAFGRHVRTQDLPALIDAKKAAGRPKDLQVLPELEGLLEIDEAG